MVSSAVVTTIKVLAGCTTFVMIASPSVSIARIVKTRSVGLVSVVPLLSLLANSHVWMIYGYVSHRYFPLFSMYALGDVLAVVYLALYWRFATERAYVSRMLTAVVFILSLVSVYAVLGELGHTGQSHHGVITTLGYLSVLVAVCLYGAPMEKIVQVVRHKSAAFFNIPMVIAGLLNNACWFAYGLVTDNMFIFVPNIFFISLGLLSLALCVVYNPKTHPIACRTGTFDEETGSQSGHSSITIEIESSPADDNTAKLSANRPGSEYQLVQTPH